MELTDIDGVGDSMAERLRDEDFSSVDDVAEANELELRRVEGVGEGTAVDLRSSARDVIQEDMHITEDEEEEDEVPEEGERPDFVEDESDEPEEPEVSEESEPAESDDVRSLSNVQDSEDEDEEDEGEDVYPLTLSVSEKQFDALEASLYQIEHKRQSSNPDQSRVASTVLDEFRSLGGGGERTVELTGDQIQSLYTSLLQFENQYKSGNMMDAYHDVSDLKEQVDEVRKEHLY